MTPARFQTITSRYPSLRIGILGDFCLDRYLEIDPARSEISIETGLTVHNVIRVRSQPGAAGTILNNLVALGIGSIDAIGFCGDDGEGYELRRVLGERRGVQLENFFTSPERRTFTYTKPLLIRPGKPPEELNRLDFKHWSPTSSELNERVAAAARNVAASAHAMILMDQVDAADTGVVNSGLLPVIAEIAMRHPRLPILADSRRGLHGYPTVIFKMNHVELARLLDQPVATDIQRIKQQTAALAGRQGRFVFVSMAEQGIVGASANGEVDHVAALPLRGEIDIVGAGDAVSANLTAALAADATLREAMELAMVAASIVIHQLGTTGTASVPQLSVLLKTV